MRVGWLLGDSDVRGLKTARRIFLEIYHFNPLNIPILSIRISR